MTVSVTRDTCTSSVGSVASLDAASKDEEVQEVKRKTLLDKMLLPQRTGVGHMEEGSLQPPITHLLHVTPSSNEKPAKGFSWGDYEDVHDPVSSSLCQHTIDRETSADADDDDDGRFVKNSYRQTKYVRMTSSNPSPTAHTPTSTPEKITKRQCQSITCREVHKADKHSQDANRVARLIKLKEGLQGAKIKERW